MREFFNTAISMVTFAFFLGCISAAVLTPIAFFMGNANSKYLKRTQNIDVPWYEAAFLNIHMNDVDANLQIKQN